MTAVFASPRDLIGSEGTALGPTDWLTIDQARVDGFAEVTGDHQWIHVDPVRAKDGPFGGTIAHGYLTLSLANFFLPALLDVRVNRMELVMPPKVELSQVASTALFGAKAVLDGRGREVVDLLRDNFLR